jgi:hypothetical protein
MSIRRREGRLGASGRFQLSPLSGRTHRGLRYPTLPPRTTGQTLRPIRYLIGFWNQHTIWLGNLSSETTTRTLRNLCVCDDFLQVLRDHATEGVRFDGDETPCPESEPICYFRPRRMMGLSNSGDTRVFFFFFFLIGSWWHYSIGTSSMCSENRLEVTPAVLSTN